MTRDEFVASLRGMPAVPFIRPTEVCRLCKGSGEFDLSDGGHPGVVEECALCGGTGVKQPRRRTLRFKGVSIPAIRFSIAHRDDATLAPFDVLRRRTYLRVYRLPFRRLFIVSWLEL